MHEITAGSLVQGTLAALAIGFSLQPFVVRLMTSVSAIDVPSDRSSHTIPTPRGGGMAVAAAVAVAVLLIPSARPLAVPVLLFAAIGLAEDVLGVPISARLGLQLAAATATATVLAPPADSRIAQVAIAAAVALWLTAFVNAFNFMDGVNGIAAAHAIVAGAVYAALGLLEGLPLLTGAGVVVAAAALTFLPWNAGRARIFLGDVGSYGLGAGLAAMGGYAVLHGVSIVAAAAPLALYLADTGWTLARRVARGEPWHRPHRTHVYQRLTDVGWSHQRVTVVTATICAVVSLCAVTGSRSGPVVGAALDGVAVVILLAYLASPSLVAARERRRGPNPLPEGGASVYA